MYGSIWACLDYEPLNLFNHFTLKGKRKGSNKCIKSDVHDEWRETFNLSCLCRWASTPWRFMHIEDLLKYLLSIWNHTEYTESIYLYLYLHLRFRMVFTSRFGSLLVHFCCFLPAAARDFNFLLMFSYERNNTKQHTLMVLQALFILVLRLALSIK